MTENTKQDSGLNGKDPSGPHAEDVGPGLPEREQPQQSVVPVGEYAFNGCRIQPVLLNGEPWFIAAEVCAALEHSDASKAVSRLDEDEKGATTVRTLGGSQEMLVVSESGLYALIFSSRKPVARAFRKWVTQEVLPSIRKTGRYEKDQAPPPPEYYVREEIPVTLPGYGRWVVTTRPGHPPHVYRTGYDTVVQDATDTDCQILAHHLMLIGAYWRKTRQNQSIGLDDRDGFAWNKLEEVILEGGYLGVRCLSLPSREPGKSWREH